MLNNLRENSKNLVMTIFFGIIIVVFVLQFNPGSSNSASCSNLSGDAYVARVYGRSITKEEQAEAYNMAMMPLFGRGGSNKVFYWLSSASLSGGDPALGFIINREILANAAEEMGFAISDDQIDAEILQPTLPGRQAFMNRDNKFDKDAFESYVSLSLHTSMKEYRESLRRSLLAQKMANFIVEQVKVSDDEIQFKYNQENTGVELEFVKFFAAKHRDAATVSDEEGKAYADAHPEEADKYYKEHLFDLYGEQIHARQILIKIEASEEDAEKEAKKIYKEASKEGADFGQLAEEKSKDESSKTKGGDLGWLNPMTQPKELRDMYAKLQPGQVSEPVKTAQGFHILKLEERKEKKPFDEVKTEIGKELAKESKAKDLAKAEAEAFLAQAKGLAPDKSLGTLIATPAPAPAPTPAPTSAPAPTSTPTSTPASTPTSAPTSAPAKVDPYAPVVAVASTTAAQANAQNNISTIGTSKEMVRAAFALTKEKPVADQAFLVGEFYVVIRLKNRTEPDAEKFKQEFDTLRTRAIEEKQGEFLIGWLQDARKRAEESGEITLYTTKTAVQPEE